MVGVKGLLKIASDVEMVAVYKRQHGITWELIVAVMTNSLEVFILGFKFLVLPSLMTCKVRELVEKFGGLCSI